MPAILIVVAALIIGGGAYYLSSRNSTPPKTENSQEGNNNLPLQNKPIAISSPSENIKLQIGSTQKISWGYSDVLKSKLQSSKNTLILLASIESVEKLGSYLGRGGFLIGDYMSSFAKEDLKTSADAGQVMKSSEIFNKTAIDWKIQDFPVSCPPGGICQGPIAEKNFEEMAKLVPGKYVITVCVYDGLEKYCSNKLTVELIQGDQISNWKTYNFNFVKKLVIKYPPDWALKEETYLSAAEYGRGKTSSVVGINLIPPYQGSSYSDRIVFGGVQSGGECDPTYEGSKYYTRCLESLVEMRTTSKNPKILVIFDQIAKNIKVVD